MKHIILCADDYGQSRAISQAIINLLKNRRITATSCMVTSLDWPLYSSWLMPYKNQIDIGLHFNLTEGTLGSSLSYLLVMSHLHLLDEHVIRAELNTQLDKFIHEMGMLPDFIDGHQHVHQFPIIRNVLLEVYEERLRKHGCYIRNIDNSHNRWNTKKLVLQLTGARAFKKKLVANHIPHNQSFSGVYKFNRADQYESLFGCFLREVRHGGLVMCHPGLEDVDSDDKIYYSRPKEYAFINSEQFLKVLDEANTVLTRYKDLV